MPEAQWTLQLTYVSCNRNHVLPEFRYFQISGDGQLPQASETGFDSLAIYLVSSDTSLNLTVSTDPTLLTQQPGSTVKHLKWQAPNCLTPGSYNVSSLSILDIPDSCSDPT